MQEDQDKKSLLTIGDAAEYLGISIDTLRRWEKKGRIEPLRSPGGHRYYKKDDLDNLFGKKYVREEETVRKTGSYSNAGQASNTSQNYNENLQQTSQTPSQPTGYNNSQENNNIAGQTPGYNGDQKLSNTPYQQTSYNPQQTEVKNPRNPQESFAPPTAVFHGHPIDQAYKSPEAPPVNSYKEQEEKGPQVFTNFPFLERPPRDIKIPEPEKIQVVKSESYVSPQEAYFRQQSVSVLTPPPEPERAVAPTPPQPQHVPAPQHRQEPPAVSRPTINNSNNKENGENIVIDKKMLIYGGIGLGVLFLLMAWYAIYISSQRVLSPIP